MKRTLKIFHSSRYIKYKTCKWCGLTKELSEFYEGRWGKKCKVCIRARAQKYRREHLEQYAQHDKARANQPQRVEARRKYHEEHKQEISEYKKKWAAENKDSVNASRRKHYELNRDDVITRSKKRAEETPRRSGRPRPTTVARGGLRGTPALAVLSQGNSRLCASSTATGVWLVATLRPHCRLTTSCLWSGAAQTTSATYSRCVGHATGRSS